MSGPRRRRRYHPATLHALLRHLTQPGQSTKTYLASHPRVSQEQIDAIFDDLRAAVDRIAAQAAKTRSGEEPKPGTHQRSRGRS